MTDEEFANYLALAYERTGVEFKGPGMREHPLLAKVVRAIMGMANHPDGGLVIIGVNETNGRLDPVGLTPEQLATWRYDELADQVDRYADPLVRFEVEVRHYQGKAFVVCIVKEFDDIPILCKKDYNAGKDLLLQEGMCYVRGMRRRETVGVRRHAEMRDLLDRAIQRGIARYIMQSRALGINVFEGAALQDDAFFTRELEGWTGPILEDIHGRGYWRVTIRPARYLSRRIAQLPTLAALLERHAVQERGWDYPHIESRKDLHYDVDWIGQEGAFEHLLEAWRFSQSGQFVHVAGFEDDWLDRANPMWMKPNHGWQPGTHIYVEGIVLRCTEIFRLAARLAGDERYRADRQMHIDIRLAGIKGRVLYFEKPTPFGMRQLASADINEYIHSVDVMLDELIANPDELAVTAAADIFNRFHWEPSLALLRTIQAGLGK